MKRAIKTLTAILLAAASALVGQAAVNLAAMGTGRPLTNYASRQLLGGIMLHNPSILPQCDVVMDTIQRLPSGARVILCTLDKKGERFAVEHYAVTLDPKGFVADGALLWKDGDSQHLTLDLNDPYHELRYEASQEVTVTINGDTIETARHYRFYTTSLGGNYFHKNGKVIFRLLTDSEGKLSQLEPEAVAVMEEGDANYLSPDHKQPTYSTVSGEANPLGIKVLMLMSMPAGMFRENDGIATLNEEAGQMRELINRQNTLDPRSIIGNNLLCYERWCASLVLRKGYYILPWIMQNEKTEHLSRYLIPRVKNDKVDHLWLEEQAQTLKDKKSRKWWEKWLKTVDKMPPIDFHH